MPGEKKISLCVLLREARLRRGLSQATLARRMGFKSGQCISDWELDHGARIPVPMLKRLAEALHVDADQFYEIYLTQEIERLIGRIKAEWR